MAHVKCRKKSYRTQGGEGFWSWDIPYRVWLRFHTLLGVLAKTGIRPNIWKLSSIRQNGQPLAVFFLWVLIWVWRDRYLDYGLSVSMIRRACERQRRCLVNMVTFIIQHGLNWTVLLIDCSNEFNTQRFFRYSPMALASISYQGTSELSRTNSVPMHLPYSCFLDRLIRNRPKFCHCILASVHPNHIGIRLVFHRSLLCPIEFHFYFQGINKWGFDSLNESVIDGPYFDQLRLGNIPLPGPWKLHAFSQIRRITENGAFTV